MPRLNSLNTPALSRLVRLMCLAILLFGTTSLAQSELTTPGIDIIQQVEFVHWDSETPPPENIEWETTILPFNAGIGVSPNALTDQHREFIWFRLTIKQPETASRYGLYFWRYNLALNVFFNGTELGGSTFRANRETMSWNRPLIVEIQQAAWREGNNTLTLRLLRSPWGGNLAPVVFGELDKLQPLYATRIFRQIEINEVLLAFGISLTLLSFLLWAFRRADSIYLWFGGLSFFWSIVITHMVIYYNPIPYAYWLPLVHVALDGAILCMYGFIGRLIKGVKISRLERIFVIWTLIACTCHFLMPREYFWTFVYSNHIVGTVALSAIVIRVGLVAIRTKNSQAIIITSAMMLQIALFIHNVYLLFSGSTAQWEGSMFYAHYGIPILFIIFVGTLIQRFVLALQTAEKLNLELESKVESSRKVIEKSFAERHALEISQAAEQERLKIYRDLHDDVGSKLLSIIHADRESKFGNMARGALESLRQAVSRVNNPDQPLDKFLTDIQEETQLRLGGSGHEVIWQQNGQTPKVIIASTIAFNLNRLLKEIVSNIIRHAHANTVEVTITLTAEHWQFTVRDNGKGYDQFGPMGNGLANMQTRAKDIDASLSIESSFDVGTCVSISISPQFAALQSDEASTQ